MRRGYVLPILLLLALIQGTPCFAQKIYLLAVGDTHCPKIGSSVNEDLRMIHSVFDANVPTKRLVRYSGPDDVPNDGQDAFPSHERWRGPSTRRADNLKQIILDAIDSCPAGPSDTIVFYWSGHGAYDDDGHYFLMPDRETLSRSTVLRQIKRKQPRLVVMLTDCCNEFTDRTGIMPARPSLPRTVILSPLFEHLFFNARGVADMNASTEGEYAWCEPAGGFFTLALASVRPALSKRINPRGIVVEPGQPLPDQLTQLVDPNSPPYGFWWKNAQQRMTWKQLVKSVQSDVQQAFESSRYHGWRDQKTGKQYFRQTVHVWSLPKQKPLKILSLEAGDVILSINGRKMRNKAACDNAIDDSPRIMVFTVRDVNTGRIQHMRATLRRRGVRFGVYLVLQRKVTATYSE